MSIETIHIFLAWCSVINMGILIFWFLIFSFFRNFIYKIHAKWFKISDENFDILHYQGMMYFKLSLFFFNIVPYIVLSILF